MSATRRRPAAERSSPDRRSTAGRLVASLAGAALVLTGCTLIPVPDDEPEPTPTPTPPPVHRAELRMPGDWITLVDSDDPVALAVGMSEAVFTTAPIAVVAPEADPDAVLRAASIAVAMGAPLLLSSEVRVPDEGGPDDGADQANEAGEDDPGNGDVGADTGDAADEPVPDPTSDELVRLGVLTVITVGDAVVDAGGADVVPAPEDDAELTALLDRRVPPRELVGGEDWTDVEVVAELDRDSPRLLTLVIPEDPEDPDGAEDATSDDGATSDDADPELDPEPDPEPEPPLPLTELAEPLVGALVLSTGDPTDAAAVATARAAGVDVLVTGTTHPGADPADLAAFGELDPTHVIALGSIYGPMETLTWKIEAAAGGAELPGGGQVLFPHRRFVALYGTPSTPALGALGEQGLEESIERAERLARKYQDLTDDLVVPAFEIIVTIASAGPGDDGQYSRRLPPEDFVPWIEAAGEAGVYVVLDLQPGRTDFLTQARQYEELLRYPNVGLALDPEWRLEPDQVHLRQIGSVHIDEVNEVIDYLAELTREHALPQKLLILHQFSLGMIQDRQDVNTSYEEVAVMIHADGQGSQPAKAGTWAALHRNAPEGVWWGWKNFYDEDRPMATTKQTYDVRPRPHFVSYQ